MTILDDALDVQRRLREPDGWCQGREVQGIPGGGVRNCLGRMISLACEFRGERTGALITAFARANDLSIKPYDFDAVARWNDYHAYTEVCRAWDRTVAYLRGKERRTDISLFEAMLAIPEKERA